MDWLLPVMVVTIAAAIAWLATVPRAWWVGALVAAFLGHLAVAVGCLAIALVVRKSLEHQSESCPLSFAQFSG